MRNCRAVGQKVGLRLTLTKRNCRDLNQIFDFIEKEGIQCACFYHLVYSGRGNSADELTQQDIRKAMNIIMSRTKDFHDRGLGKEILTVDNHADNVYIYLKMRETDPLRADVVYKWMKWNGGGANSSGIGISNIDWLGNVHPDQFWQTAVLGNVRQRPFSEIWSDNSIPRLAQLRDRLPLFAAGFIFTFHFFNTHFRIEKFPMDTVIFSGRVSKSEMLRERKRWWDRLTTEGKLDEYLVKDDWDKWKNIAKTFGYAFFGLGVILLILIIYAMVSRLAH
ncbi:MAG: hypothetical protein EXS18_06860 [Verrucomicrobiae bacterium]|nr:hypothetical protein [Verrucomicrobiae bacterium]